MEEMTGGASDASNRPMTRVSDVVYLGNSARAQSNPHARTPPAQARNAPKHRPSHPVIFLMTTNIIRGNIDNDRRRRYLLQQNNHPLMRGLQGDTDPHTQYLRDYCHIHNYQIRNSMHQSSVLAFVGYINRGLRNKRFLH